MELDRVIKERHSTRIFSGKSADWRSIILAIDAANSIPLAGNIPTLKFILISDREKIMKIAQSCQQEFFQNVKHAVVVCSDEKLIKKAQPNFYEKFTRQQAGAAIQNFLLKISDLELAACWVGAFSEELVKETLKIPQEVTVEAILPVGHERSPGKPRRKSHLDNVLFFDSFNQRSMKPMRASLDT